MKKLLLFLIVVNFSFAKLVAQKIDVWNQIPVEVVSKLERLHTNFNSEGELYFTLDLATMKSALYNATNKKINKSAIEISIPNKNGVLETYQVWENSNMDTQLQMQFPEIRAYVGKGITDKSSNIHFSLSPVGFQAMVFRPGGQMEFLESYDRASTAYVLFSSKNRNKGQLPFECTTLDTKLNQGLLNLSNVANRSSNKVYKTMRLALSCTGEYGVAFGGTVSGALAAMNATMSRVNGVFENDLALHLNIIANNTAVIYTNASTDPYSIAANKANWNSELQNTLNAVIGAANYDIGHLFGASGGGGNAGCIGCVCVDAQKGSGITSPGSGLPSGDTFDIDYVAHEMGHQLGGNHSFTHGYEGTIAQVEPGSGSTIMGYAGITSYDVQAHSDAIFAYKNIYQIQTNLASKTCLSSVIMTNNTPIVDAGLDYTIPKGTPFILTGSATDADAADVLTYTWEQNDLGSTTTTAASSRVLATKTTGPTFRILPPSTSPIRFLPELSRVLSATQTVAVSANTYWETVSTVARSLNFTLTARDNQVFAGQTGTDAMLVTVNGTTGPFLVTSQAVAGISYAQGSSQTITWDVANTTTLAGANTVDILLLSNINGNNATFTNLANGVLNNGSVSVVIPSGIVSSACRFMVKASGNIFYAVNTKSFSIYVPSVCLGTPSPGNAIASVTSICGSGITNLSLQNTSSDIGITYQWQSASDVNGNAGSYSDIANANGATYSPTVASDSWYRCNVTCSGAIGTSIAIKISIVNSNSIVPTFTVVAPICSGATLAALPTTSTNGIGGAWSPVINATATTTYTFSPSAGQCATNAMMTITVNSTLSPNAAAQVFCSGATVANLTATGTAIKWYSVATGGTFLASTAVLTSGIYYVSQTLNSCESNRVSVAVTVNTTPVNTIASINKTTICSGDTISLSCTTADGVATVLSEGFDTFPPTGWTFINAGTGNTWATSSTSYSGVGAISYTYNTTNAANAWAITAAQNLTAGTTYTIKYWYKVRSSSFPENLKLTVGNSATAAGQTTSLLTQTGLINTTYAQATATFTPTSSGIYYFGLNCYSALDMYTLYVDEFSISRSAPATYLWSSTPAGFTSTLQNPGIVTPTNSTSYSVFASIGNCASAASSVAVTVNTTSSPTATLQTFCGSATVANLVAGGTAIKWYAAQTSGIPLSNSTSLTSGIYYASQTINSCESPRIAVTVSVPSSILPTFTALGSICSGDSVISLPTTSNNGITGSWAPNINNTQTTLYTFTPIEGFCANSATMTITVNSSVAGIISGNQTITTGTMPINITLSNYTGSIQWQSSIDGVTYSNINGATNPILLGSTIGALTVNTFIRAAVKNGNCNPAYSSVSAIAITCCKFKFN